MNRRNAYTVPDFPSKEITSYFSELGIDMVIADVLKPTQTTTQRIYESLLAIFVGPPPQILGESLQVINIVQRMGSFLMRIGIQNFTIKDLSPDSRRLIQILSTIANFGMYRDNKRQVYEKVSTIADTNYKARSQLESTLLGIKEEMRAVQDDLDENTKTKETLENEIRCLENELREFYKHQKDKISEVSLLKAEKTELNDKLSSCQLLEHNMRQEITCLKTQVVSDPTKLLELVEEMRQLIERERDSIKAIDVSIAERNARCGYVMKCGAALERIRDLTKDINETDEKIEKFDHNGILLENKLKNWDSSINAIKIRINHIDRQISHLESKIFNLQSKDKKCSEEISTKIGNLRLRYDAVSGEREEMTERIRSNNKLVQDLMYQKAKVSGEFERECSEIISALIQLTGEVDTYFSEVNNCFDD